MPRTLAEAFVMLRVNPLSGAGMTRYAETAGAEAGAASGRTFAKAFAGASVLIGVGVAAAMVEGVKAAGNFQSAMTRIVTGAGEVQSNLKMVSDGVLAMAGQVGQSTEQLTKALYLVESAGYHGADGLNVLKIAAEGAKVGNADLGTTADALTTVMNAYRDSHIGAAEAMNALIATEGQGKTNLEDLAGSLSKVLPAAAAAHVGLNDVLGAMATMTSSGTSADNAATYLRQTILQLSNPTAKAALEMKELGLNAIDVSQNLGKNGLASTLEILTNAIQSKMGPAGTVLIENMKKAAGNTTEFENVLANLPPVQQTYIGALANMVGGTKSMQAALELTGPGMKVYQDNVGVISEKVKAGGQNIEGWSLVQQNLNQKLAEFRGTAEALSIKLGEALLPKVTELVGWFTQHLPGALADVAGWVQALNPLWQAMGDALGIVAEGLRSVMGWISGGSTSAGIFKAAIEGMTAAWISFAVYTKAAEIALIAWGVAGRVWQGITIICIGLTEGWTGAVTALGLAFDANPIGIIVLAIAALVGVIIYCWFHFKGFRDVVLETWDWIKKASIWAWENVLKPTFHALVEAVVAVGQWFAWLWQHAIKPAWDGIVAGALWLWGILKPIFDIWWGAVQVMAKVYVWLWKNVLEPAFHGIGQAVRLWWDVVSTIFKVFVEYLKAVVIPWVLFLWTHVFKPTFEFIWAYLQVWWAIVKVVFGLVVIYLKEVLFPWLLFLWTHVVKPTFESIWGHIQFAWGIIKVIFSLIVAYLKDIVFPWFRFLWTDVVKPTFEFIWGHISDAWHNKIKPIFEALGRFIKEDVAPAFKAGVDAIGSAWDAVVNVARMPVEFIVNTVLNDGIIAGYNWLADKFGVPRVGNISLPWTHTGFDAPGARAAFHAAGGYISGPGTGTSDSILSWLSDGEYVIPAHKVREYGVGFFNNLIGQPTAKYPGDGSNGLRGFAGGGLVEQFESNIDKLFTDPGAIIRGPLNAIINSIPGHGAIRDVISGMPKAGLGRLVEWATNKAKAILHQYGITDGSVTTTWHQAPTAGAVNALEFLRAQVGKPYVWASAGPGGYDCSGIVSAVFNVLHGANPYNHTFSTSNEAPFFPIPGVGGMLTAGWSNPGEGGPGGGSGDVGHTAGVLMGVPFESTGGVGVRAGTGITPVGSFAHVGHFRDGGLVGQLRAMSYDSGGWLMPGPTLAYNGTGRPERVTPQGAETRLDDYTIAKLAQALQSRPVQVQVTEPNHWDLSVAGLPVLT